MTDTDTPTGTAVAVHTPAQMVKQYEQSFAAVLPSHIAKPETWIRLAQGALKKGRTMGGGDQRTELEVAAANNPGVFLATLLDCARLGLEPGTEQYYLTPRKVKGRLEILGIVGYQGLIELMYRAGAVESVVAECVYSEDGFAYRPGVDLIPQHEIDWDLEDRGELRLVYAYARMIGGAISKVVVLNKSDIAKIKAKAQNPGGDYSPWRTDPSSMWLKSAVRQLRKWVPTSAEYRREQLRAAADVAEERAVLADQGIQDLPSVDALDGDVIEGAVVEGDDDIVDAEIVDEPGPEDEPPPAGGGGGQDPQPAHGGDEGEGEGPTSSAGTEAPAPTPDGDEFPDLPQAEPEPAPAEEPVAAQAPRGSIGVNDVARYARQVFKADYDAAERGDKTKVVERLRHAVTFAQTGGRTTSLNDLEPEDLWKVNQRLRDIAGGALKYRADDDGVTFISSSGRETRIDWARFETASEPAGTGASAA